MAGNRDVCPVFDTSYFEQQVEPKSFERKLYTAACLADSTGYFGIALHGRLHGQRRHSFPPRSLFPANQRRTFFCQKSSHGFGILGLCVDVPSSWISLEHDAGNGKKIG